MNKATIQLEDLKSNNAADQTRERLVERAPEDEHQEITPPRESTEPHDRLMQQNQDEEEEVDIVSGVFRRDTEARIE